MVLPVPAMAAEKRRPHLGGLACGELGVLTDVHRLLGNDVPLGVCANVCSMAFSLRLGQHIFPHKVAVVDDLCRFMHRRFPILGEDGELSCQHLCGLVQPGSSWARKPASGCRIVHVHLLGGVGQALSLMRR